MALDPKTAKPVMQKPAEPGGGFDLRTAKPVTAVSAEPETTANPSTWKDRLNALGTGFNAGLAGLAGMPMDAAANVVDLGKAALGSTYGAITGEAPPLALQVDSDRSNLVGSSEWVRKYLDKNGITTTQMTRPDDVVSRFVHASASAIPSLAIGRTPSSGGQAAAQTVESMAIGAVPQAVAEAGGDPALQQAAGLLASAVPAVRSSIPSMRSEKPAIEPPRKNMTAAELHQVNAQKLLDHGIELTQQQRGIGFKAKAAGEAGVAADTLLGPSNLKIKQGEQFTQAILRQGGLKGTRTTPDALAEMHQKVAARYDKIHEDVPLILDERARIDLETAYKNAADELGPNSNEAAALRKQIDNLYEKATLTPEAKAAQEAAAAKHLEATRIAKMREEDAAARAADREYEALQQQQQNLQHGGTVSPPTGRFAALDTLGGVEGPLTGPVGPEMSAVPAPRRVSAVEQLARRRAVEAQAAKDQAALKQAEAQLPTAPPEPARLVSGKAAQRTREALGRMTLGQNGSLRHHAGVIQNTLDEILQRSAPDAATAKEIADTRQQYHRFKQITEMAAGRKDGIITPQRANQVLSRRRNQGEYVFGRGDQELADLVRAGQSILSEFNDTGTARRGWAPTKVLAALSHPALAAKAGMAILGGRVINERNSARGTPQGDAAYANKQQKLQAQALRRGSQAAVALSARETEDELKRRLRAEALRK